MQADSLAEIRRGLDRMVFDFGGVRVGNRPASEGHVINAALVYLMSLPDDQRREALSDSFAKINALMTVDDPQPEQVRAIIAGQKEGIPAGGDAGDGKSAVYEPPRPASRSVAPKPRKRLS